MRLDRHKPCMHACMSGFQGVGGGGRGPGQNTQLQGKREVVGEGEHMVAEKDTVCGLH